jgi:hypothetical protein
MCWRIETATTGRSDAAFCCTHGQPHDIKITLRKNNRGVHFKVRRLMHKPAKRRFFNVQ